MIFDHVGIMNEDEEGLTVSTEASSALKR